MSETMGECERSVIVASDGPRHPHGERRAIASAIDRLAADVAEIKEAVCDGSVAEERDRFFAGWAAALNERDKLRAEIEKLKAMLEQIAPEDVRHFVESEKAWVKLVEEQRDAAIRERDQWREEARLAGINRDEARAEVERLKAELAALPAAGGWMTAREKEAIEELLPYAFSGEQVKLLANMLARAGSPPVVVLPTVFARSLLGDELVALQQVKDSLDKAGVSWREVPRGQDLK